MLSFYMGSKSKQVKFQDEIESIDRRRSGRIIALKEKKQQERERKLAVALERKNNPVNHDIKNKGKGKATMEVYDDLNDSNEHGEGPTMRGCKSNKIRLGKKPKNEQRRMSRSVKLSPNPSVLGTKKRDMHWPPIKPLVTEVLDCNKPEIQLNKNSITYKESLLRFVKNLGPVAQRVACRKLEALQTPKQPATLNDNWHACAATLLSNSFSHIDKSKSHGTSTGEPNMLATRSSNNVFARVHPTRVVSGPQPNHSKLSLMSQPRPNNSMSDASLSNSFSTLDKGKNHATFAGESNMLAIESSNNVFARVYPTLVVPRSQPNLSELSLMSQPRPNNSIYDIPTSSNLTMLSAMHQHQSWPIDSMSSLNPLRPFPLSQPNLGESIPSHEQFMHQVAPYTPPVTQGFPNMQMQMFSQLNSLGPVNYYADGGAFLGQQKQDASQLLWDNDYPAVTPF